MAGGRPVPVRTIIFQSEPMARVLVRKFTYCENLLTVKTSLANENNILGTA